MGWKFYKNTKKSSLLSQNLLIFIHKNPVVENHPTTKEIRDFDGPGWHRRETWSIFTWAARSCTYWKYTDEASNIASDVDIMENIYMFVMLSNLSVISHLIFPQCRFLISDAKSKNNFHWWWKYAMFSWILFVKTFIHVHVKCNITKKLSFLGLKFGIVKPLQSINYKL